MLLPTYEDPRLFEMALELPPLPKERETDVEHRLTLYIQVTFPKPASSPEEPVDIKLHYRNHDIYQRDAPESPWHKITVVPKSTRLTQTLIHVVRGRAMEDLLFGLGLKHPGIGEGPRAPSDLPVDDPRNGVDIDIGNLQSGLVESVLAKIHERIESDQKPISVSQAVNMILVKARISDRQLARRVGTTAPALSRLGHGKSNGSPSVLEELATEATRLGLLRAADYLHMRSLERMLEVREKGGHW
jgi:hypothetical protein